MYLQQNADGLGVFLPPGIDGLEKMQRIYGFHQRSIRKHQFELIGLQMTYEVPFDVERKLHGLGSELLRTVLPEGPLALPISLQNGFERVEFGNCHQFDP